MMLAEAAGEVSVNLDLTLPDTARMIDFWLGGNHHFEVDRAMARKIETMTPIAPHWARIQRAFLGRVVSYIFYHLRLEDFVVAGAGLPTCGNVHEIVPEARVLYMDINPITVAYGKHILGKHSHLRYIRHDATDVARVSPVEMEALFGNKRRLAVIFVGLSYFFPDAVLSRTLTDAFHWLEKGSCLVLTSLGEDSLRFAAPSVEAYHRMGHTLYPRSARATAAIVSPWSLSEHGVRAASHWGVREATEPAPPVYVHGCLCLKR